MFKVKGDGGHEGQKYKFIYMGGSIRWGWGMDDVGGTGKA
jgi:hypothetical protein